MYQIPISFFKTNHVLAFRSKKEQGSESICYCFLTGQLLGFGCVRVYSHFEPGVGLSYKYGSVCNTICIILTHTLL